MKNIFSIVLTLLALVLLNAATFTVQEHQQAIIIQFGKIKGDAVTKAGLHFKIPFIQNVKYFEKRILQWEGDKGEVPTFDKKFIWVDTTARWRIADALLFYKTVKDIETALARMGPILDGATKDTVSGFNLTESVRNTNKILDDYAEHQKEEKSSKLDSDLGELDSDIEKIAHGREKLSEMISERARVELVKLGIELIDVMFRSIAYQESVEKKVFQSMIEERNQIATKIRSSGQGEKANILGQLDLALKKIESEAYKKSQIIRGQAEAEAMHIYAKELKEDPHFFEFVKTLETYKNTIAKRGQFVLSTDNAFLGLLKKGG
jgi:membrane protease subunit HflC